MQPKSPEINTLAQEKKEEKSMKAWHHFYGMDSESYDNFHGFVAYEDKRYHIQLSAKDVIRLKEGEKFKVDVEITDNCKDGKGYPSESIPEEIQAELRNMIVKASQEVEKTDEFYGGAWSKIKDVEVPSKSEDATYRNEEIE